MKSIRLFLSRHFGFQNQREHVAKVQRGGQAQSHASCYNSLSGGVSVLNGISQGQLNNSGIAASFYNNVSEYRQNISGVNDLYNDSAQINRSSAAYGSLNGFGLNAAALVTHRPFPSGLKARFRRSCRAFVNAWRAA